MPAQRLTMRRVRKLLRLHYGTGASARAIARELGVSRSTVKEYLARAAAAELTWPLPADLSDAAQDRGVEIARAARHTLVGDEMGLGLEHQVVDQRNPIRHGTSSGIGALSTR